MESKDVMAAPQPELTPKPDIVRRRVATFLLSYIHQYYILFLNHLSWQAHCFHRFIHSMDTHVVGQSEIRNEDH